MVAARVAHMVFEGAVLGDGGSPSGTTIRVLVTHQLQFLPSADHLPLLRKGRVLAQGTYADVKLYMEALVTEATKTETDDETFEHE